MNFMRRVSPVQNLNRSEPQPVLMGSQVYIDRVTINDGTSDSPQTPRDVTLTDNSPLQNLLDCH